MKGLLDALATAGRFTESVLSFGPDPDDGLPETPYYRRLTASTRDLTPDQQLRVQQSAIRGFITNPFTRRMVQLPKDFTIAEGLRPDAPDEKVKAWLDAFWDDPVNAMDDQAEILALEYELLGEVIVPAFVGPDARVRITLADPLTVSRTIPDPGNGRTLIGVEFRGANTADAFVMPTLLGVGVDETQVLSQEAQGKRIRWRDELAGRFGGPEQQPRGVFYFGANRLAGMTRGSSDVSASLDHLDLLDRYQFDMLERAGLVNAFVWDVLLKPGDTEAIKQWKKDHPTPPRPGTVNVHNEGETWTPMVPDLKHADLSIGFRTGRNYVIGNLGYAPAWVGETEINRASAQEQGDPALKTVTARQRRFKRMILAILRYVVWEAVQANQLAPTSTDRKRGPVPAWSTADLILPEISPKDVVRSAGAFAQVSNAVAADVAAGLLSRATAIKLLAAVATHLGVEFDPAEEATLANQEAQAQATADAQRLYDAARAARGGPDGPGGAGNPAAEPTPTPHPPAAPLREALAELHTEFLEEVRTLLDGREPTTITVNPAAVHVEAPITFPAPPPASDRDPALLEAVAAMREAVLAEFRALHADRPAPAINVHVEAPKPADVVVHAPITLPAVEVHTPELQPAITVEAPHVEVHPPDVHVQVPAPEVHVEAPIDVHVPPPVPMAREIEHDEQGRITKITERPAPQEPE